MKINRFLPPWHVPQNAPTASIFLIFWGHAPIPPRIASCHWRSCFFWRFALGKSAHDISRFDHEQLMASPSIENDDQKVASKLKFTFKNSHLHMRFKNWKLRNYFSRQILPQMFHLQTNENFVLLGFWPCT